MRESEVMEAKCEKLATIAPESKHHQVDLSLVQMQIALSRPDVVDFTKSADYLKNEVIVDFLLKKAQQKIESTVEVLDENKIRLTYLLAANDLGLNLSNLMFKPEYSHVTQKEIEDAKIEFKSKPIEERIVEYCDSINLREIENMQDTINNLIPRCKTLEDRLSSVLAQIPSTSTAISDTSKMGHLSNERNK